MGALVTTCILLQVIAESEVTDKKKKLSEEYHILFELVGKRLFVEQYPWIPMISIKTVFHLLYA